MVSVEPVLEREVGRGDGMEALETAVGTEEHTS